jgi:hypothetical protein
VARSQRSLSWEEINVIQKGTKLVPTRASLASEFLWILFYNIISSLHFILGYFMVVLVEGYIVAFVKVLTICQIYHT